MEKEDLCFLYDSVYSGRCSAILSEVGRGILTNNDIGFLCRYACEYYLHWGPEETIRKLSRPVLRTMKLDNLVGEMETPPEVSAPEKRIYLFSLMYPEHFGKYKKEFFVTAYYQSVLTGQRKEFPRGFFSGGDGAEQNARICLMFALQVFAGCRTPGDCMRFMSSKLAVPFLKEAKLYYVMKRKYRSPTAYIKDALALTGMLELKRTCMNYQKKYLSAENWAGQAMPKRIPANKQNTPAQKPL